MPDATITPNTEEIIRQINANMAALVDYQNLTFSALLALPRRTINAKSWQFVDQAIQTLER